MQEATLVKYQSMLFSDVKDQIIAVSYVRLLQQILIPGWRAKLYITALEGN